MSFLFAYGFEETVGARDHAVFLGLVTVFALVVAVLSLAVPPERRPHAPVGRRLALAACVSTALHGAVVGIGSIVSAMHKEEGSVSAGFTSITDVLVAATLFAVAGAAVAAARRVTHI
jgi:hypothetical protein